MINLRDALRLRKLDEFIVQEEARGMCPPTHTEFNEALKALLSEGQTSHSSSGDGLSEKQTRQGSDPRASR